VFFPQSESSSFTHVYGKRQNYSRAILYILIKIIREQEYVIRKVREIQVGLELYASRQILVYADDDNLLDDSINTIKENTETLLKASRDIGLEINAEKTKYTIMSRHPNSGQNQNIRIANESFEKVAKFK
jgi:hypothetical protein